MKSWRRLTIYIVLFLAWAAFAGWQYNEYRQQQRLAREILHRQSHSIMNALVGGIRSHCRLGRFIREQLQGVLDELVESDDILAVSICDSQGRRIISAGDVDLVPDGRPLAGNSWAPDGYLLTEPFSLTAVSSRGAACTDCIHNRSARENVLPDIRPHRGEGKGLGPGGGLGRGYESGRGRGLGPGLGRGLGKGPAVTGPEPDGQLKGIACGRTWLFDDAQEESRSPSDGLFDATLVLDRGSFDALCRIARRECAWAIIGGAVVMLCVAAAWASTVRLVEARGRAEVLELEARHLRELSQAATGLAHETRNSLGLVRGWTQQLSQSGLKSPEDREHARAVVEECDRITARINQFLAYAKPCQPSLEAVRAAAVVDELAILLQPDLEARQVKLDTKIDDITVRGDREMFRAALFNLLQNAISFSPQGQTVEISGRTRQDGGWLVEVSDRGPGVSAEHVDSLFMPYFTTRADGTGLGLAIVSRIAVAHGWKVEYHARPDGGAVFRLSLDSRG